MLRTFACAMAGLVIAAGILLADEVKGKVKKVDTEKNTISIMVDGQEKTLKIGEGAKVLNAKGVALKEGIKDKALKAGAEVMVTTDKDEVKEIKLGGAGKK